MPVSKAKKDARVLPLLEEIQAHYKISFHRSEGDHWGSNVVGHVAHIYYQKTKYPGGALAHELLHALVQHRGYRRLRQGCSMTIEQTRFKRLRVCLDNELQHHKMYPEFARLGFAASEFYEDHDGEAADYLESVLASRPSSILDVLPDYFTLIAPGGSLSDAQLRNLNDRFMNLEAGRFAQQLTTIRSAIDAWRQSDSYDAQPTLRSIFLALQNPSYTWLGYSTIDRPPNQGFFIDRIFEVETTG